MAKDKKLCEHCDKGRTVHSRGYCRSCYDTQLKLSNPEYAKRQYENMKAWRLANQDRVKQREKERWSDPAYVEQQRVYKWSKLLESYSLTQKMYDDLVKAGCQICGDIDAKKYHLDHCHKTQKFRGLLCSKCNNGLGMLGDDSIGLQKALEYILTFEQQNIHTKA